MCVFGAFLLAPATRLQQSWLDQQGERNGGRGGGGRGGGGRPSGGPGGFKGGKKVIIEPHRHAGVFIARGKEDALVTKNMIPGETIYGEKRISVDQVHYIIKITEIFKTY